MRGTYYHGGAGNFEDISISTNNKTSDGREHNYKEYASLLDAQLWLTNRRLTQ